MQLGLSTKTRTGAQKKKSFSKSIFIMAQDLLDDQDYMFFIDEIREEIFPGNIYSDNMDFILAEIFGTKYKNHCLSFYTRCGAPLRELVNKEEITILDEAVCAVVKSGKSVYAKTKNLQNALAKMREMTNAKYDFIKTLYTL